MKHSTEVKLNIFGSVVLASQVLSVNAKPSKNFSDHSGQKQLAIQQNPHLLQNNISNLK